jgi:small-conductance mechanosensitive channel
MLELNNLANDILEFGMRFGVHIRIGIAIVIILILIVAIKLVWHFLDAFRNKLDTVIFKKIKPFKVKNVQILDKDHLLSFFDFVLKLLRWVITIALLVFTVPLILSLFEQTRGLAGTLFSYIITPFKNFALAVLGFIPNVISIIIILTISRYAMRLLKFFARQITIGKLKINGFYPDWANMTFNLLRILLYAFTLVMVFPLLPGSDSQVFQGVSILVGVIFSLGSSSAISNLIAGIVITYMRPYKVGDCIKINDIMGHIVEKNPMTTRVRTYKNEFISFPNLTILNASITNYNSSTEDGQNGLVLHIDVTFTYHVPWTTIHEILLRAADNCEDVEKTPAPYVQQKRLDDFYCVYELNAFTKKVNGIPTAYSHLNTAVQNSFAESGLDMTAPHFFNLENSGEIAVKKED